MAKRVTNLAAHIETILLVTVITLIVWIIAEGANLAPGKIDLTVQFRAVGAVAIKPELMQVTVEYKCPNSRIEDFRDLAARPITINIEPDEANPDQVIDLSSRLNDHPTIRDMNVSISRVDPPRATLRVEPIKAFDADVIVVPGELELAGEATHQPLKVTVRATPTARSLVVGDLQVEARLAELQGLDTSPKGQELTREVPVTLPPALVAAGATVNPPRVKVTFTILKQTATYKMPSVPLLVRVPILEGNKYEVVPENNQQLFTEGVEFTGPREIIEKLSNNEIKVFAELRLTIDDLEKGADKGMQSKALFFDVPPGVIASPHRLNFTIKKRPAPAATTTP